MKLPMSLKALAVVLTMGSFGLATSANAYDDYDGHDDGGEVFLGIIGQIAEGAIERREARREYREYDRYCFRLREKCDWGEGWACRKYWRTCDYE
jgi:hypothetical protein